MTRLVVVAAVFPAVFLLTGCARAPHVVLDVASIAAHAARADFLRALSEAAHRGGAVADVAASFGHQNPRQRFAAVYLAALWADERADADVLRPLLNDTDERIRAIVAGSLAGLGDAEAVAAVDALSSSTAVMPFSDPPLMVKEFVRASRERRSALQRRHMPAASPASFFFPTVEAASSLTSDAETITIKVPIDVIGGSESVVALWHAGIDDAWNHGNNNAAFEICGRKVVFVPEFRRLPADANASPDSHVIVVEEVRPGQYYISTVWHQTGTSPTDSARTGFWGSDASPTTAAHEFGHLLGLDDEYIENDANGNGVRDPGETPIPDTSKHYDAAKSAMGVYGGAVLQRHVEAAVDAHDVGDTLEDCTQEILIKGFYNSQPQNAPLCNGARANIEIKLNVKVLPFTAEGSGDAWIEWRRHNPCEHTLWGGMVTKPGATATIKMLGGFDGRTQVTMTGNDSTESFLIDGTLVADAKAILPYWLELVKGTNVQGSLASFTAAKANWVEGATFTFENRAGDRKGMVMNYGSATLEICRKSTDGPFKGCTLNP